VPFNNGFHRNAITISIRWPAPGFGFAAAVVSAKLI